jgi:hypothetical protein
MTPAEQLAQLKTLTRELGCIHEAQAAHLRAWPRALFDLDSCKVEVDFQNYTVTFRAKFKESPPTDTDQRLEGLADGVRDLLGAYWGVRFYGGRKCLLKADGKTPPPQPLYSGADFSAGRILPETPWNPKKTS